MSDPLHPARAANAIGRKYGLTCKYERDPRLQKFTYRFFRYGRFIGSVANATKVVAKMEAYVGSKQS